MGAKRSAGGTESARKAEIVPPAAATTPDLPPAKTASRPDFPDDPRKWDGWRQYHAKNFYERLCLDPRQNPTDEQIQQHCTVLLSWWQKKLPLKNQPSNPIAQLLGRGLEEAARYLAEARLQLLNPSRRRQIDQELAAAAQAEVLAEFAKYVGFSIQAGLLNAEAEANLREFGQRNGLGDEEIEACIEKEMRQKDARRGSQIVPASPEKNSKTQAAAEAKTEFIRILRLSEMRLGNATEDGREILVKIAHNLGIDLECAEHMLDSYLEDEEILAGARAAPSAPAPPRSAAPAPAVVTAKPSPKAQPIPAGTADGSAPSPIRLPGKFVNPVGASMFLIPGGEFVMGSEEMEAAPNEQPLTPVKLSQFYMSHYPVTNAQYECFDPAHRRKRLAGAGDDHPVVHVTSLEAIKFLEWLGAKDRKKYRLPTEAEWEYAARGRDGRKYPWGNECRQDLANFADASTNFPWRDGKINDGYPESAPVGAFPGGASFFGIEDMAGNVWEWCLDFYQPLAGTPRQNPRGAASGGRRVYRGGSWKSRFSNLRATARASNAPNYSCNDLGFRTVCEC